MSKSLSDHFFGGEVLNVHQNTATMIVSLTYHKSCQPCVLLSVVAYAPLQSP